jgi:hypothetical protein
MVIRTEYRGTRYSMRSSDPLPAGFEIRFGGLNFQTTGNGYLMCLTNREELRARRQAGSAPVAAAHIATTQTTAGTDAAGPSASRRRAAPVSVRARRGPSDGKLSAPPPNVVRPSARRQPPRRGSARSPDRASPSVCAARRRPTPPTSMSAPRCAGFPLAVMFSSPGTLAPPPGTSRPWAPSTRCPPPTCMGMQNETSPACRTQSCSDDSSTPRTTGSVAPTTPAPGATTPRGSAALSSPTTQQIPPERQAPAKGKLRPLQGPLRAWQRDQAPLLLHPQLGPTSTRN